MMLMLMQSKTMSILPLLFLSLPLAVVHATDPRAPDTFQVNMTTDVPGTVTLNITRAQAPHGADHFYALVQDNFFDNAAFFRVVPQFVAQFGIAGIPKENTKWEHNIPDDAVLASNTAGTLTFATTGEPNSRNTQLFFNTIDNSRLDKMGFAPFGLVTDGLPVVKKLFDPTPGDDGGIDQNQYVLKGNKWLKKNYPKANFILSASVLNEEWFAKEE